VIIWALWQVKVVKYFICFSCKNLGYNMVKKVCRDINRNCLNLLLPIFVNLICRFAMCYLLCARRKVWIFLPNWLIDLQRSPAEISEKPYLCVKPAECNSKWKGWFPQETFWDIRPLLFIMFSFSCHRYPFTADQEIPETDWEVYLRETANAIVSQQTPQR
jgi:hypothetical protein